MDNASPNSDEQDPTLVFVLGLAVGAAMPLFFLAIS